MARPTKKQMEEAKKSAAASAPIVAPAPLPIAIPAVQPAPLVAPGLVHQQPRHIDPEGFIRVRDSALVPVCIALNNNTLRCVLL
ncbi:hypothetical protein HYQ46_011349 [Verticillium longisporum]|nr:hypothetical protein HYQ46_011349 [Verticillium longisporum]